MDHLSQDSVDFDHVEPFFDVVFGVVAALPLMALPGLISDLLAHGSWATATTLSLQAGTLIFCVFYWLEGRHFAAEQRRFEAVIGFHTPRPGHRAPPSAGRLLLGVLFGMGIVAATLAYAHAEQFRAYLTANLLFWLLDFSGPSVMRAMYRPHAPAIAASRTTHPEEYRWFFGNIASNYFLLYPGVSVAIFGVLLLIDALVDGTAPYRFACSIILLAFVLFRHLVWRSRLFLSWLGKQQLGPA